MNLINASGWTLLHFLWQGGLIACLLAGALALLRHSAAKVRYAASCAAMVLMLACAAATFLELRLSGNLPDYAAPQAVSAAFATSVQSLAGGASSQTVVDWLPALVWAWLAGVVALSIRSVGGWAVAARFARRHTSRPEAVWEERLAALAARLRISTPVKLAVSSLAEVPAVVGWLRPIVLVPTSIFTGLSAEQIDALLAHELAHVRRHDYLINLVQTAAETLFFYHPAVWWVNRKIREERENCCDDLAVEVCGSTVAYVRALTDLEQMRRSTPRLAMAADGGSLLNRVQRLLRVKQSAGLRPSGWTAGIAIAVAVLVTGIAANGLAQRPEPAAVTPAEQQNADKVRQQVETALKNVDAELQNVDVERLNTDTAQHNIEVERQRFQLEQMAAALQRQAAAKQQQNASQDAEVRVERQRAALQQLEVLAQLQQAEVQQRNAAQQQQAGWLAEIRAAGYPNLTVDQLIGLKEHGVTGEYIRQIRAAGQDLSADDLMRFREHGVTAAWIREIQSAGYPDVSLNDIMRLREHGVTGEYIRQIRAAGQELPVDDLMRFREHGITPEFITDVKQAGFKDVKGNDLIRLREHGADGAWIRQIQSAGYPDISLNDIMRLREYGMTPESIRDARKRFKDLTLNQLIRMKESGVF